MNRQSKTDAGLAVFCAFIFLAICAGVTHKARSQDLPHHSPDHEEYYSHWMMPTNPSVSCCHAHIHYDNGTEKGVEIGDCDATVAEIRNGDWWAINWRNKEWIRIPDSAIIHERNPTGQDAHLCISEWNVVFCFSPPDTGG